MVGAIAYGGLYTFPALSVAFAEEFGINRTLAVTPWTMFLVVTAVASPLLGRAYDAFADRDLLTASMVRIAGGWLAVGMSGLALGIDGGVLLAFGASASVPALALAGIVAHGIRSADRLGTYAPLVGLVLMATVAWSAALWIAGPRRRGAMSQARLEACAIPGCDGSVHLIVRTKVQQERLVACPAEQDPQVAVNAECPVGIEVALELVGSKEQILRVGGKSTERGTQHRRLGFSELPGLSKEPT